MTQNGTPALPYTQTLTLSDGETIAELTWMDNGDGRTEWCKLDGATMVRDRETHANLIVRVQASSGSIRRFAQFADVNTAFWSLGLSAHRCNGIDGWAEMAAMPGSAGRD